MTRTRVSTAAVLLLGGAITVVALSHPQSSAQDKAAPPAAKWEYKVVHASGNNSQEMEKVLNPLGAEG